MEEAQPIVHGDIFGLAVLSSIGKQAEQVIMSKLVSNAPPWPDLSCCHCCFDDEQLYGHVSETNPFLSVSSDHGVSSEK